MNSLRSSSLLAAALLVVSSAACPPADEGGDTRLYATEFTLVSVTDGDAGALRLAVQACAGLYNRRLGGSVYVRDPWNDESWLTSLDLTPARRLVATEFLAECTTQFPRCVKYAYEPQQKLLPNILTVGAALGAVPLDVELAGGCTDVAFDAVTGLAAANTPALATQYVLDNYANETTGLAMLNPGYDEQAEDLANPPITRTMPSDLIDFVYSEKLFVVFLVNGCEEGHPEREVLFNVVNAGRWPTPLPVYGYNNSWLIAGYLHEAQTRCLKSRNMGAVPTTTGNMSFFSRRRAPISDTGELAHNAEEAVEYDPTKTYVAFVVGDGDNVRFIMTSRKEWLGQRLADCADESRPCAPLTWSISPRLHELAPDVLQWYFASSKETGHDYFTLPPSGALYAYPSSMFEEDQDRFVASTEAAASILGVKGVVHWDYFDSWREAENFFLPRYARAGVIKGIFPINVPFFLDVFPEWPATKFFTVLSGAAGGETVVFKPRQWRGIDDRDDKFFVSPQRMADELGGYPAGTVTWVYMTSDGGLTLENSFAALEKILPANVRLVSADTASRLALEAAKR